MGVEVDYYLEAGEEEEEDGDSDGGYVWSGLGRRLVGCFWRG